ncbi:MAG: hypothetical protein ACI89L_000925 [Phycisphaerales bacterium]|jgi:hypothetical protein
MFDLCIAAGIVLVLPTLSAGVFNQADLKATTESQASTPPAIVPPEAEDSVTAPDRPSLLLVETENEPMISLSWYSHSRGFVRYSQRLPFAMDADRVPVGDNIEAFASVGGTRIVKSAGHPMGSVVKGGFYKLDAGKPWFDDIDTSRPITVTIAGVRFNQPVQAPTDTSLMHTKYAQGDLESCGLPGSARAGYATGSDLENLNGKVKPGIDTRLGALSDAGPGSAVSSIDSEGLVTVIATFPYRLLKNLQDPWASELPGTFLEPVHFHFEFEAIPADAEPIDWVQRKKDHEAVLERLQREGTLSLPGGVLPDEAALDQADPDGPAPEAAPAPVEDREET